MKQLTLSLFLAVCMLPSVLTAQKPGYLLTATIHGYEGNKVYLGYRHADKVYSKDTTEINNGKFVFEGEESLPPGIYLVLMPPDNKYFEFLVTKNEQRFSMETSAPAFNKNLKFKGSKENELLAEYQSYMASQVEASKKLQEAQAAATDEAEKEKLKKQLEELAKNVRKRQDEFVARNPGSFTALLVKAFQEPEVPEPPKRADGTADPTFQFNYFKARYFDSFDFSQEIFVNTPYLKEKIDRYLGEQMTFQIPDSIIAAVDLIIGKAEANREVFRWVVPYLLNKYYSPEIMGLEKVFVHIADKYYASGKVDWATEETLKKIRDDAYMMRGVLIGNVAPEVKMQLYDRAAGKFTDNLVSLHEVNAEFTVVFLWKPGCGHCKHTTDELKPFYAEWKEKGVEIFSISSANHSELEEAIKDIKEKNIPWIVTADPYLRARALQKFYGTSLPKLYLLDKDKKIIASRVGVAQLPNIIENYKKMKAEEK